MKKYVFFLLFILSFSCYAFDLKEEFSEATYGIHTVSIHDPDPGYNNGNMGLYLKTKSGWTVGEFYNSFKTWVIYYGWTSPEYYRMTISPVIVEGYTPHPIPFAIPSIRLLTIEKVSLRMACIPKLYPDGWIDLRGCAVYHFMLEAQL